jgi:hypothetical protein
VWGREEAIQRFDEGNLGEKVHLEDPDLDGRIILI